METKNPSKCRPHAAVPRINSTTTTLVPPEKVGTHQSAVSLDSSRRRRHEFVTSPGSSIYRSPFKLPRGLPSAASTHSEIPLPLPKDLFSKTYLNEAYTPVHVRALLEPHLSKSPLIHTFNRFSPRSIGGQTFTNSADVDKAIHALIDSYFDLKPYINSRFNLQVSSCTHHQDCLILNKRLPMPVACALLAGHFNTPETKAFTHNLSILCGVLGVTMQSEQCNKIVYVLFSEAIPTSAGHSRLYAILRAFMYPGMGTFDRPIVHYRVARGLINKANVAGSLKGRRDMYQFTGDSLINGEPQCFKRLFTKVPYSFASLLEACIIFCISSIPYYNLANNVSGVTVPLAARLSLPFLNDPQFPQILTVLAIAQAYSTETDFIDVSHSNSNSPDTTVGTLIFTNDLEETAVSIGATNLLAFEFLFSLLLNHLIRPMQADDESSSTSEVVNSTLAQFIESVANELLGDTEGASCSVKDFIEACFVSDPFSKTLLTHEMKMGYIVRSNCDITFTKLTDY